MNNVFSQILLFAIFFVAIIVIADWAMRPNDRDDDD